MPDDDVSARWGDAVRDVGARFAKAIAKMRREGKGSPDTFAAFKRFESDVAMLRELAEDDEDRRMLDELQVSASKFLRNAFSEMDRGKAN